MARLVSALEFLASTTPNSSSFFLPSTPPSAHSSPNVYRFAEFPVRFDGFSITVALSGTNVPIPAPVGIMKLPLEVRNMIYNHIIDCEHNCARRERSVANSEKKVEIWRWPGIVARCYWDRTCYEPAGNFTALMRVNKAISHEVGKLVYSRYEFRIQDKTALKLFLGAIGQNAIFVRRVTLDAKTREHDQRADGAHYIVRMGVELGDMLPVVYDCVFAADARGMTEELQRRMANGEMSDGEYVYWKLVDCLLRSMTKQRLITDS